MKATWIVVTVLSGVLAVAVGAELLSNHTEQRAVEATRAARAVIGLTHTAEALTPYVAPTRRPRPTATPTAVATPTPSLVDSVATAESLCAMTAAIVRSGVRVAGAELAAVQTAVPLCAEYYGATR